jgi:hypothetical protein
VDQGLTKEMLGLQRDLAAFIADGKGGRLPQRLWIKSPYAELYVRSYTLRRGSEAETWLDIGQITVVEAQRRRGICRAIFSYAEEFCVAAGYHAIRVENVTNEHLEAFLVARGYRRNIEELPCYVRKMADIHFTS